LTSQNPAPGRNRGATVLLWVAIIVTIALLLPLRGLDVSVEVYGVQVAVWLLALVFYLVGVVAGWASFRARAG
jgi:hypothetical protein